MSVQQDVLEEYVVGILLRNPELILKHTISPAWFTHYRNLIGIMIKLAGRGDTIDVVELARELGTPKALPKLVSLHRETLGAKENLAIYLRDLEDRTRKVSLRESFVRAIADIDDGSSANAVVSELISSCTGLMADNKTHTVTMSEGMSQFIEHLESVFDAKENGGVGIKTGMPELDKVLGGLHPSDMTIVGARPSVGKTAFGVSVLLEVAKSGRRCGFFSTEMSTVQIMSRIVSMQSGIPARKLRDADLDEQDYARLTAATLALKDLSVRICDKPAITVSEVGLQSRAWALDGGIDFILVDYLTRLRSDKNHENQNLAVGEIATGLKDIARTLGVPVMVLAQVNRDSAKRADKRPTMADLRDSGMIEQEADQIIMLYRDALHNTDAADDEAELIVEKNRHGECLTVECKFDPQTMRWYSYGGDDGY